MRSPSGPLCIQLLLLLLLLRIGEKGSVDLNGTSLDDRHEGRLTQGA